MKPETLWAKIQVGGDASLSWEKMNEIFFSGNERIIYEANSASGKDGHGVMSSRVTRAVPGFWQRSLTVGWGQGN